jgi:iron complex outermembrane receptor protein
VGRFADPFLNFSAMPAHLVLPIIARNDLEAESYGVELALDWPLRKWWRLQASYAFLKIHTHLVGSGKAIYFEGEPSKRDPQNQVSLRSSIDLPLNLEFDFWIRYVDNLPSLEVNSYITFDIRLGWRPTKNLEFSLVGQNLLENKHLEFTPELSTTPAKVPRSVYGKIRWLF